MSNDGLFRDKERLVGYVTIDSGSLMLSDSLWDNEKINDKNKLKLDLEEDRSLRIPVTTIKKNGQRFILLAIDLGTYVNSDDDKMVVVEGLEDGEK